MMKLTAFIAFITISSSSVAWAYAADSTQKNMSLEFWGGYTTVGMGDVNNALKNAASGGSVTEVKDGTLIGADFLYKLIPGVPKLSLGPRIEYLFISSGKLSQSNPLLNITDDYYVIPIMVGGKYLLVENGNWSLSGALFLGLGMGYGKSTVISAADPSNQHITNFSGSDMTGLLMADGQYRIDTNTFIGVDLGYRMLNISQMSVDSTSISSTASGSNNSGYAPARAPVVNASGNTVKYDFSGIVINIGINFMF